jgi:hypothetical protein
VVAFTRAMWEGTVHLPDQAAMGCSISFFFLPSFLPPSLPPSLLLLCFFFLR